MSTEIETRHTLTPALLRQARDLRAAVNAAEGLDLKIHLDDAPPRQLTAPYIVAVDDEELLGFATLDGDAEIELCGVVNAPHRRRHIGDALLARAVAEARRAGATRLLLINEEAALAGQQFVARHGGALNHVEWRMALETFQPAPPRFPDLTVTAATAEDLPAVAGLESAAFDAPAEMALAWLRQSFDRPTSRITLARLGDEPVASLRVSLADDRALIYGFGVATERRGQGLGAATLSVVLASLREEGWRRIGLEVSPENTRAVALYQRLGFVVTTKYGYYRLPIA